ncbi:MAG: LTA synthase family protein [Lachnospiraceae bacterium]|nr:LTA synthase family protein [Lachnospiraceae bacterium]
MLKRSKKAPDLLDNNIAKTYSKHIKTEHMRMKLREKQFEDKISQMRSARLLNTGTKSRVIGKIMNGLLLIIAILCGFLGALIYGSSRWVLNTWGNLSMDEIIFHLKVPVEGTNADLIQSYLSVCVSVAIIILFAVIVLMIGVWKKPIRRYLAMASIIGASLWAVITSVQLLWTDLNINEYIASQSENSTFIQDNYVDPRNVAITFPAQKRNLIYIYLESMESTYMDTSNGGGFEENYIPELTELAKNNINFSNTDNVGGGYATTGATWTMGGLFAQTSALPLKIPVEANSMNEQSEFFPDIISLGDILKEEGYSQMFMCGSDATFGGRRKYFEQHGNYNISDWASARTDGHISDDYGVWWGYEDEKLFDFAREELTNMSSEGKPFNFTLLTADTHFEDGYVCQLCKTEFGDNQYANVMTCSSRQVTSFVKWIQQQDFYENTTIVISGDHLTMDSDFCNDMVSGYTRGVYNTIINAPIETANTKNREFSTLDMLPTTLASLGVEIAGNKLGLGTNLFSNQRTLVEQVGINKLNKELEAKSNFFENFTKSIVITAENTVN